MTGSENPGPEHDPSRCPLCGGPNHCQQCTQDPYKGPCWCFRETIPEALLALVPVPLRKAACICQACLRAFHDATRPEPPVVVPMPGDFYWENGRVVFTEAYLRRRGLCCRNGCRHCPYGYKAPRHDPSPSPCPGTTL